MADKEITMVLEVDLDCERCNKKIRKVLHKIQDKMNIKTISFDEKRNEVTISGPFDAEKVRRKLCCKAGRIIKGVKAPEEKKTEEKVDGAMEKGKGGGRKPAAAAPPDALRSLLQKMLEHPKAKIQPGPCSCGKKTTAPPAQGVVAQSSLWPAPASSVSDHAYDYVEAPSYYGVPVYSIDGLY